MGCDYSRICDRAAFDRDPVSTTCDRLQTSFLTGLRSSRRWRCVADTNSEVDEAVHRVLRASEALGLCNSMEAVGGGLQGTSRPIGPDAGGVKG